MHDEARTQGPSTPPRTTALTLMAALLALSCDSGTDVKPPPAAPSQVTAVAVSAHKVEVTWVDNASDETSFVVDREEVVSGTDPGSPVAVFGEVAQVGPDVTTFRDDGLPAGTSYRYRIRACNQNGCSGGENGDGATSLPVTTQAVLAVETEALPAGTLGESYTVTLTASGGDGTSYAWSLVSGTLPEGLALSEEGVLSGTPTTGGVFDATFRVTSIEQTADKELTVIVPRTDLTFQDLVDGEVELQRVEEAPLTAEAVFRTMEPVTVTVQVGGKVPVTRSFSEPAQQHYIPILGLYPGQANSVELLLETQGDGVTVSSVLTIETDPLPELFPDVTVTTANMGSMEPGWTLSSFSMGDAANGRFLSYPFAFDANGDVRWYMDLSDFGGIVYLVEQLRNGDLIFGHGQSIYEYDALGRKKAQWDFPGFLFHHDVIEKDDGNFVVAVDLDGGETVEDQVIEVDRETGQIVTQWDFREILDPQRTTYIDNERDWLHMNGVWWDENDDALIMSARNQSAVVKVNRDGEIVWILAAHQGWETAPDGTDLSQYLLTAVDAQGTAYGDEVQDGTVGGPDFGWTWGQHAPLLLPGGNLFVFDNGFLRNWVGAAEPDRFSRGVEYVIDEEAMTVRQVWEYGRERGPDYYSSIISDVDYLSVTGNRLIAPGITAGPRAYITEVTEGKSVVFDAFLTFKNLMSNGEQVWGGFDLAYRAERVKFWPEQ